MISLIITIIYLAISIYKLKRVPESISDTSYLWTGKINWFSIYCLLLVGSIFLPWVLITPETYQFICFLSCSGILACGVTPFFKQSFEGKIHYTGGIIAMLCWLIQMVLGGYWIALLIGSILFIILTIIKKDSFVFWGEIIGLIILSIIIL